MRAIDADDCPACGFDHLGLPFWINLDSRGVSPRSQWIGICPEEGEPLAIMVNREDRETIVAPESATRKGLSR